jgi:hypothetical protein
MRVSCHGHHERRGARPRRDHEVRHTCSNTNTSTAQQRHRQSVCHTKTSWVCYPQSCGTRHCYRRMVVSVSPCAAPSK